jgi:hypothetical protein
MAASCAGFEKVVGSAEFVVPLEQAVTAATLTIVSARAK